MLATMPLLIRLLLLGQLAVHQTITRPISRPSSSTGLTCNDFTSQPLSIESNDRTMYKRAIPPPPKTPKAMEPMSLKEAHGKMIKANAISAARESTAGFTGAFKTVGYGFQQGYRHAKQAYHQFAEGNGKHGLVHLGKGLGKMMGGVILAPVPAGMGLYTGAKRMSHVAQHTYKYLTIPRDKLTSISPTEIRTIEAQLKYNTPTRDRSKKYVQDKLRYTPPS